MIDFIRTTKATFGVFRDKTRDASLEPNDTSLSILYSRSSSDKHKNPKNQNEWLFSHICIYTHKNMIICRWTLFTSVQIGLVATIDYQSLNLKQPTEE